MPFFSPTECPRVADIGHPQLLPQFFSILAIFAIHWLLYGSQRSFVQRIIGWSTAQIAIVAQFYSSFYLGWFLVFSLILAFMVALISPRFRPRLLRIVDRDLIVIWLTSIIPAILISPLLGRYLEVATASGYRSRLEVFLAVPVLKSWIYSGPNSWLYGWMPKHHWFLTFGSLEPAHRIGLGLVTPVLCLAGLWLGRRRGFEQIVATTGMAMFFLVTLIPREIILCLAVSLFFFCMQALWCQRFKPRAMLPPAILYALIVLSLFPFSNLWLACQIATVGIVAGLTLPSLRNTVFALTGVLVLGFLFLSSFVDKPVVLACVAANAVAHSAMARRSREWVIPPALYALVLAIAAFLILSPGNWVMWKYCFAYVPAGGAIRVAARAILLTLVPLAIGFALFWEWCGSRGNWKYAVPLGMICLLEQGLTTTTFDKLEARQLALRSSQTA